MAKILEPNQESCLLNSTIDLIEIYFHETEGKSFITFQNHAFRKSEKE